MVDNWHHEPPPDDEVGMGSRAWSSGASMVDLEQLTPKSGFFIPLLVVLAACSGQGHDYVG